MDGHLPCWTVTSNRTEESRVPLARGWVSRVSRARGRVRAGEDPLELKQSNLLFSQSLSAKFSLRSPSISACGFFPEAWGSPASQELSSLRYPWRDHALQSSSAPQGSKAWRLRSGAQRGGGGRAGELDASGGAEAPKQISPTKRNYREQTGSCAGVRGQQVKRITRCKLAVRK